MLGLLVAVIVSTAARLAGFWLRLATYPARTVIVRRGSVGTFARCAGSVAAIARCAESGLRLATHPARTVIVRRGRTASSHAGIRRHVEHRSPRAAHGAGPQSAVEEKSEVEGASAASINDGAGDARDADGRESDHGEEFASQRRVHQVTNGP